MTTKAKTIKMLLYDGSLSGVMNISNSAWDSGKMYSAPRESINALVEKADCKKYGVYLLLSDEKVYVGQASDLERRTRQHLTDKDWWNKVILMTTKDDGFNASDIDYLEASLIDLASKVGKLDSDNKKKGNPQKVDEFRQTELEQYLGEALFLLELIGVRVFKKETHKPSKRSTSNKAKPTNAKMTKAGQGKPALPDYSLPPGVFVKTALTALLDSGYTFTDEQMSLFGSIEGSKQYTTRKLPLFWILKDGESRSTCDKAVRSRYWKDEFESGQYRFLMYSQWFENKNATKEHFINWYNAL